MRRPLTALVVASAAAIALASPTAVAAPPLGFANNFVKSATRDGLVVQLTCPKGQTYGVDGSVRFAPSDPTYGAEYAGGLTQTYLNGVVCTGRPQKVSVDFGGQSKDGNTTYPTTGSRVLVCAYAEDFADPTKAFSVCLRRELVLTAPRRAR